MVLAAFSSRSRIRPHFVPICVRTPNDCWLRSPHPVRSCAVYAGSPLPPASLRLLPGTRAGTQDVTPSGVLPTLLPTRGATGLLGGPGVQTATVPAWDRFGASAQRGALHRLARDRVGLTHQGRRRLAGVVGALPPDVCWARASNTTAVLRRPPPCFRRLTRRCAFASRFSPPRWWRGGSTTSPFAVALRRHQEHLRPRVDAGLPSRLRKRLRGHLSAAAADVPAIRFFADRDGLGRSFDGARPPHCDAPDLAPPIPQFELTRRRNIGRVCATS
jgi:hypothetical protein